MKSPISREPYINEEIKNIEEIAKEGIVIIATGPLTSDDLAKNIQELTGQDKLYFYDAAAPIRKILIPAKSQTMPAVITNVFFVTPYFMLALKIMSSKDMFFLMDHLIDG